MSGALLELTEVVKHYAVGGQTVRALDDVSLTIERGEFAAIIGPSGSGKSTLLNMLGALDVPDSGTIRFDGQEISEMSENERSAFRRNKVGFIFQFFNLIPTLSAWENVALPKLLEGSTLRSAKPRALELLDRLELSQRAAHRPDELSGGQMQRVAIARALMMDPPLILADEPTGNLDSAAGIVVLDALGSLAESDTAVLMVTHDTSAIEHCGKVITMLDGRVGRVSRQSSARVVGG
ncbi:MAG: ABC transporter ATP-binding protein [Mycobacterium sp.]